MFIFMPFCVYYVPKFKSLTRGHNLVLLDAALLHNFNVWTYMTATHIEFFCARGIDRREIIWISIIQSTIIIHFKVNYVFSSISRYIPYPLLNSKYISFQVSKSSIYSISRNVTFPWGGLGERIHLFDCILIWERITFWGLFDINWKTISWIQCLN